MSERIDREALENALRTHLPLQRWYAGSAEPADVVVEELDLLADAGAQLLRAVVLADGTRYQLLLAGREPDDAPDFLHGHEHEVLGVLPDDKGGKVFVHDGVLDPALALALLELVSDSAETAERVRPMGVEQSNTSLVYDDRLVLKVFRRLADGPSPDVEVTAALAAHDFGQIAEPLAVWRRGGRDLAVLQPYLAGASEGWALALASLRDLYATALLPADSGGDFAGESCRLGEITARLHLALAAAFGAKRPAALPQWLDAIRNDFAGNAAAEPFVARLGELRDTGSLIRVHGDYHLGQVVRTDAGWFVLDFEGEPARPVEQRQAPASPLKDVAGMLRSFHYATEVALAEAVESEREGLRPLARAWEDHNRTAFLEGYLGVEGVCDLLPADPVSLDLVLRSLELEKAVYEVAYERAHRPDWEPIPQAAIDRLLAG